MATGDLSTAGKFYVYALLRGTTGTPFYIGKGHGRRWDYHEWEARKGRRNYKSAIIRSLQARHVDVIKIKIHEYLSEETAHEYESALIKALGRHPNGPLVNLTEGGEGVSDPSPEVRVKMAAAKRGRKLSLNHIANSAEAHRGLRRSAETRANMSKAQAGKTWSPESRAKLAAALRGRTLAPEHIAKMAAGQRGRKKSLEERANIAKSRIGKKHPPETRAKIAAGHRGKKLTPEAIAKRTATRQARGWRAAFRVTLPARSA